MAEIWKKVHQHKAPFSFTIPDDDSLTGKWHMAYNLLLELELGGKDLEYLWAEEEGDEPKSLDEFGCDHWDQWLLLNSDATNTHFGYVTGFKGKPYLSPKGVGWMINFEMLSPVWIREAQAS
jgi:hypothetical protein